MGDGDDPCGGADAGRADAAVTWAALLGRWIDLARSAVALPDDAAGRSARASVPDLIALQAVCLALRDLPGLPAEQRAIGVDRGKVLIDRHAGALQRHWGEQPLPGGVVELIDDARAAWREAAAVDRHAGGA